MRRCRPGSVESLVSYVKYTAVASTAMLECERNRASRASGQIAVGVPPIFGARARPWTESSQYADVASTARGERLSCNAFTSTMMGGREGSAEASARPAVAACTAPASAVGPRDPPDTGSGEGAGEERTHAANATAVRTASARIMVPILLRPREPSEGDPRGVDSEGEDVFPR